MVLVTSGFLEWLTRKSLSTNRGCSFLTQLVPRILLLPGLVAGYLILAIACLPDEEPSLSLPFSVF